jgi:hypothetical protein
MPLFDDDDQEIMRQAVDSAIDTAITGVKRVLQDEELPELSAQFQKRYYDCLVKAGFTKAQSLSIVARENPLATLKTK